MYEEVNAALTDGIESVDMLLKSRIEAKQRDPSHIIAAGWKEDESLRNSITILKDIAKVLSNGCIKLILLMKAKPSNDALASLLSELSNHAKLLTAHYFKFLENSVADCLFDSVTRAVRTLLSHIQDFLRALQSGSTDSLNYMVGMVTKIVDAMEKIPLSNKQAYRTLFMQNCILVKETLQEFKAYLDEAREKRARQAEELPESVLTGVANIALSAQGPVVAEDVDGDSEQDSDEEYDEDDCEDELDYTPEEVRVVEASVVLLGKTVGCIKHTLFIATTVCDATIAPASASTAPDTAEEGAEKYSQQWVAQLAHLTQLLNKDALDLGAELYPPFESDLTKINANFDNLRSHCLAYLQLVNAESLRGMQSAEHVAKIAELTAEITNCTLSI